LSAENSKGVKYVKWTDKWAVHMLTTRRNHSCSLVEGVNGQIKSDCVFDYNKAKKGVDISEQIGAYYSVLRKTIKWYRKVILELMCSTFVVNSWYIHKKWGISNFNVLKFRELIIDGLLQDQPCEKIETKSNKSTQHFLKSFLSRQEHAEKDAMNAIKGFLREKAEIMPH
jgi:hypothetical protein